MTNGDGSKTERCPMSPNRHDSRTRQVARKGAIGKGAW